MHVNRFGFSRCLLFFAASGCCASTFYARHCILLQKVALYVWEKAHTQCLKIILLTLDTRK